MADVTDLCYTMRVVKPSFFMKVAVCISGAIRYPHIGLKSIKNILSDDINIFIHTWKVDDTVDFISSIADSQYKELDKTVTNDLSVVNQYQYTTLNLEDFSYRKIGFENQKSKYKLIGKIKDFSGQIRDDIGPISMHYSIYAANELKKKYERENNMKFDCVIRMRFDSDFEGKILDVSKYSDKIYIPEGEDWFGGINDQFALGSSESMDIYSNLINNLEAIQDCDYHPEIILRNYLNKQNVKVERFDFSVRINNNIDFRRVMLGAK